MSEETQVDDQKKKDFIELMAKEFPDVQACPAVGTEFDKNAQECKDCIKIYPKYSGKCEAFFLKEVKGINIKKKETPKEVKEDSTTKESQEEKSVEKVKVKKVVNQDGSSVTKRVKELACEDPSRTKKDILKLLDKEGYVYNTNNVYMSFRQAQQVLDILKEQGKI